MCLDPFRGWLYNNHIVMVTRSDVTAVYWSKDNYKIWKGDPDLCTFPGVLRSYTDLPCRHCAECYEQSRKEWINRAVAESLDHDKMLFLTLTYDDVHLSFAETVDDDGVIYKHYTLVYRDFQLFIKRLRKHFADQSIRYLVCGEYGTHGYRPHYHAIIYGLSLDDFMDLTLYKPTKDGLLYVSDLMTVLWSNGFAVLGPCNIATVAYVAGYVVKKSTTIRPKQFYNLTGIVPPFIKSSNKPGLGSRYISELRQSFDDVHDYKLVFTGLDSKPLKLRLTPWQKRLYELDHGYNPYENDNEYSKNKDNYRSDFVDKSTELLLHSSDMSVEDFRSQRAALMADQSRRKRGL